MTVPVPTHAENLALLTLQIEKLLGGFIPKDREMVIQVIQDELLNKYDKYEEAYGTALAELDPKHGE